MCIRDSVLSTGYTKDNVIYAQPKCTVSGERPNDWQDSTVLTAARTAGAGSVCKEDRHMKNDVNLLIASLWGACLRFASLRRTNSRGVTTVVIRLWHLASKRLLGCDISYHLSKFYSFLNPCKVYIFQESAEVLLFQEFAEGLLSIPSRSTIDLCLLNLPKRSSFNGWLKVFYR